MTLEPYSAEELELLRTDVSYQTLRNGRWFATLAAVAHARDAEVAELVAALAHMKVCASCAQDDWSDCPHGLHALGLLAKYEPGTPPAPPPGHATATGGEAVPGGGGTEGGPAAP